ncbi:hypothetical protein [Flammeovirga pacifica]|uniref:Uncharacterized protein n=1 Tax=Flammeovirga pacifica TaxID=915059 RepID=A0A1S1YTT0_FLAPC|nr:hypothetical protein [Flammeovirga pacifica]OHX64429.1 hypothetical protein NH26_22845 [Flammeovirga pacifica]
MKNSILLLFLILSIKTIAQSDEFDVKKNGLIYNNATMHQLQIIVDSINQDFNRCDLDREYLSVPQATGHFFKVASSDLIYAARDLKDGITFKNFIKKYPKTKVTKEQIYTKAIEEDYSGNHHLTFFDILTDKSFSVEDTSKNSQNFNHKFIYEYDEMKENNSGKLEGIYFTSAFNNTTLPKEYARMVQYSECMIDTSETIINVKNSERKKYHRWEPGPKKKAFNNYYLKYLEKNDATIEALSKEQKFQTLLVQAIAEVLDKGGSDDYFEEIVEKYYAKETALELKRSREVWGQCSMDDSPRLHAFAIAQLSAETVNWEIFLRAHLDIMNDNFSRMTDGSYAYGRRNTYIKELEELNFNVSDLLIGISLRVQNCGPNHYFGNISRIGRALAETKNKAQIESMLISMIENKKLDTYNRIMMYYLYFYYGYFSEGDKSNLKKSLRKVKSSFPKYIADELQNLNKE